jgi:cytochrome P450
LPGPLPSPFIGNILDKGFDDFVEYTERMRKKYGDMFEIYFGPARFIMLSKYEYMTNMFDYSLNSKYMRRLPYIPALNDLDISGKGIAFNHDIRIWKYNRHFISRALLTPSFSNYAVTWIHNLVEEMMEFWKDASDDNGCYEANLVDWSFRFTTDAITYLTTGKRIHSMQAYYNESLASQNKESKKLYNNNNTKDATKFFESIQFLSVGVYFFIIVPTWIRRHFPFIRNEDKKHIENRDWLFNHIDEIIKKRKKEIEFTPRDQPLRFDMLTSMITANTDRDICEIKFSDEEHTKPMTDEEIRGVLWETCFGGIDTTAYLFTFIAYYLAEYPYILKRLRNELDQFFKNLGDHRLDIESLSNLVYTEAIIKEVFRLVTPAPYTARNSTAEDIVGGHLWPEGTQYIINLDGINRNEEYWDEPEKFDPDRWINGTVSEKLMPYVVFGAGRRVCPGRKLSFIELKSMIALIYHKVDIELVDKNPKFKFMLIRGYRDLNVRIKPRQV